HHYTNRIIQMDTNLKLVNLLYTIDSITTPQIKVKTINTKDKTIYTLSAPPLIVNKNSAIFKNWLLINSGLISDNESQTEFKKNHVIDLYSLKDGSYKGSFYLPKTNKGRLVKFAASKDAIIVIYENLIESYENFL